MLAGNLVAGWQLARALLVAERKLAAGEDVEFMRSKIAVARFYAEHVLTRVPGLRDSIVDGVGGGQRHAARGLLSMQIDFISDVTCPWCAIGLRALERAIARLGDEFPVALRLQPLELNPASRPTARHRRVRGAQVRRRAAGAAARQALIRSHAAEAGLHFPARTHVYNTFEPHRLLLWAERAGRERALKHALLEAYHVRGENPGARGVLLAAAQQAGLDGTQARGVLDTDAYAGAVRTRVRHWEARGVSAVPTILVDDRTVLRGGQTAAALEGALRQLSTADGPAYGNTSTH